MGTIRHNKTDADIIELVEILEAKRMEHLISSTSLYVQMHFGRRADMQMSNDERMVIGDVAEIIAAEKEIEFMDAVYDAYMASIKLKEFDKARSNGTNERESNVHKSRKMRPEGGEDICRRIAEYLGWEIARSGNERRQNQHEI